MISGKAFPGFRPTTEITRGDGERYAYKTRVVGIGYNVETEIHDFTENVGWTGIGVNGPPRRTQWVFEEHDSQTRFTFIMKYSFPMSLLGLLLDSLLVRSGWRRNLGKSL
jgi:hypothetical protein